MKPFVYALFFFSFSALAHSYGVDLPLSAENFFQPMRPTMTRNPEWPGHLTLQPVDVSPEYAHLQLQKFTWRKVWHCHGEPVTASYLQQVRVDLNGVTDPGMEETWTATTVYQAPFQYPDVIIRYDSFPKNIVQKYQLFADPNGSLHIQFEDTTAIHDSWPDQFPRLMNVPETNERVFEIEDRRRKCPDGTPLDMLMVPMIEIGT